MYNEERTELGLLSFGISLMYNEERTELGILAPLAGVLFALCGVFASVSCLIWSNNKDVDRRLIYRLYLCPCFFTGEN